MIKEWVYDTCLSRYGASAALLPAGLPKEGPSCSGVRNGTSAGRPPPSPRWPWADGGHLVRQALEKGLQVVGIDACAVPEELISAGAVPAQPYGEVAVSLLARPADPAALRRGHRRGELAGGSRHAARSADSSCRPVGDATPRIPRRREEFVAGAAMMRHGFGGHPFGPEPNTARGRNTSRVGGFWTPEPGDG